ncbi:MAG: CDC48 family AAA ATPase [Candidatus Methanomethyliaceae archaeon]|nr:CDC48 family AAA ATPase [Candidatus Methanomethyliaceae archaeon]
MEGKGTNDLVLRVAESKQRDVGRGKVRIDADAMKTIGVSVGDIIEIEGKRKTAAIVWPAYTEDQGMDIIRMDGLIRKNASVGIGERLTIRKAEAKVATLVKLAPLSFTITVDSGFVSFVKRRLADTPLVEGDNVLIPVLGQAIPFSVVSTKPADIVMVTEESSLTILEKPAEAAKVPRVTYEDIGGLEEPIRKVREMVELPLKHPELFKRLGIDPPKGVLLYGPPGCGKTLLAKVVANETEAYFIAINGPEVMSKFYGESEQKLREFFDEGKQHLDAIAPKREEVTGEVEKRVVAQLLALMDGLEARGDVIVIGATNRQNALDPALRRPGRFDREIEIGVPSATERYEIFQVHTRNMPLSKDVDLKRIANLTHGFMGADIAALCRESAMKALRRYLPEIDVQKEKIPPEIVEKIEITMVDFEAAFKEITPTELREVYVEVPTVRWEDIGGLEEIKQELREAIEWPLKYPERFKRIGIKPPKGILLFGPPGCGKTLLAKAIANESESNFITIKGAEIFSKWVGESEKAIREVFRRARTAAPAIIFFDEIDSIAPVRSAGGGDSLVTERVISQMLTELDGLVGLENVVIVGATNRPDIIDSALLRPGRFDRLLYVPEPDNETRLQIFKINTKGMPLKNVDFEKLTTMTRGFAGSDIEAICREAGLIALRNDPNAKEVTMHNFEKAMRKIRPSITEGMEKYYKTWEERSRQTLSGKQPLMNFA